MPNVLIMRPIHDDAIALLRAAPGVTVEIVHKLTPEAMDDALPRADGIIVRTNVVNGEMAAKAPGLKIVARHGVGYDLIDVPGLTARGVAVTITPEANAGSVAEHALMLMLACNRRTIDYDKRVRSMGWGVTPELPTRDVAGQTVLILGFGRIGTRVARLCAAFGMRVLVRDPFIPVGTIRGAGYEAVTDLPAALAEADIVTLHLPSSGPNRGLVGTEFLAAMKRGAVLINTARGALVQEEPLAEALRSGQVGMAGLDVVLVEPMVADNPLLGAPNIIFAPHIAASTNEGTRRMAMSAAQSVLDCFNGVLPEDVVVNPEVLRR
ncbi:NAD(P)-dependent oxidoreductase [Roseomonas sp. BN140053]|uniref:NAD(P)-dependent oxidoreductase n=1 Tax=Roseomonas sp. BN140053 TaxID=3391898 RepID=UPI0039E8AADF